MPSEARKDRSEWIGPTQAGPMAEVAFRPSTIGRPNLKPREMMTDLTQKYWDRLQDRMVRAWQEGKLPPPGIVIKELRGDE